jgi:hypothetical protein
LPLTSKFAPFYIGTMNLLSITYTYIYCISFAENYVFTKCKKCVNLKTNKEVKLVYNNGCLGYNINGKFYSRTKLKPYLVKVKKGKDMMF